MDRTAIVVEDDTNTALALTSAISSLGFAVRTAGTLKEAKRLYREKRPDVVLLDVALPDGDGLELMHESTGLDNTCFVVITGDSRQDVVVRSLRAQAADFLLKPVTLAALKNAIERSLPAANDDRVRHQDYQPRNEQKASHAPAIAESVYGVDRCDILLTGDSIRVNQLKDEILKLAGVQTNVVITGEEGVGKAAAAFALHRRTPNNTGIAHVKCATGQVAVGNQHSVKTFSELLVSAFSTEAGQKRVTLILDNVEQLSEMRQRELLSYLSADSIVECTSPVRPRIVCIKRSPDTVPRERLNNLIPDLHPCLVQSHLDIPTLQQRHEDILPMVHKLLELMNTEHNTEKTLSNSASVVLMSNEWPGNVQELVTVVSLAFQISGSQIEAEDILPLGDDSDLIAQSANAMVGKTFWEVERVLLQATLEAHEGDKKTVAKTLGISLKTLYNRMNAYNISL